MIYRYCHHFRYYSWLSLCLLIFLFSSIRSIQGIHFFPRVFFLYFTLFHVYFFSCPVGFTWVKYDVSVRWWHIVLVSHLFSTFCWFESPATRLLRLPSCSCFIRYCSFGTATNYLRCMRAWLHHEVLGQELDQSKDEDGITTTTIALAEQKRRHPLHFFLNLTRLTNWGTQWDLQ